MRHYHVFGLKLASELPLTELHPGSGPPDVTIRLARRAVRESMPTAPVVTVNGSTIAFCLEGMCFSVKDGREIDILAPADAAQNDVRIWLLGTVMAALLHQRGYLPIHANAVRLPSGGAAAFAGPSGAGKSTMAALLERAGFRVLGDDLCAIRFDQYGRPMLFAGIPRLKLWGDTLDLFGRDHSGYERVASDLLKYHVPLECAAEEGTLEPIPLERIYLLADTAQSGEALITPLRASAAAGAILANAFRWGIGQSIRGPDSRLQFDQCLNVARHCAVFRLARHWGQEHLFEEGVLIAAEK